ncbi:ribonuclease-domain-containing protein [Xylariaceae sp. FL0255]|nr:ribonuclease-domain-containing protein [Xylariaceae sp. FL0255]
MFGSKLIPLVLAAASVSALTTGKRETCVETCGSTCYYQSDIDSALAQGYNYFQEGKTVGSDEYPHQYNDYEGFSFPDAAPWYEFPILNTYKVYTGGSPGADRVIFDKNGNYQDLITHTGASGDDFVDCTKD